MRDLDRVLELAKAVALEQKINDLANTIREENGGCKDVVLNSSIRRKYNIDITSSLAIVVQGFYEKGLKDAKI